MAMYSIIVEDVEGTENKTGVRIVGNAQYENGEQNVIPTRAIVIGQSIMAVLQDNELNDKGDDHGTDTGE